MEAAESTTRYLAVKNDPVQPVNISTTELVIKEEFLTPNSADEDDKCSLNHYYCSNGDPDNLLCRDESSESEGSEEDPGPINDIEIDDSEEYLYKILEIDNPTHNLKISKVWSISENSGNAGTSIAMNFIKNIDAEPKNFQQPESSTKRTAKSEKTKFFTPEKLTMDVDVESSINSSGDELVIDESGIDSEEDENLKMKPTLLNKSPSKMVQIVHPRIHYSPKSSKVASVLTPDASTNYADFGKSKNLHTTNLKLQRGEDELFKELSQSVGEPHETLIKQTESFLNKVKTVEPPNNEKSQSSDFNEQEKKFLEESDQQLADIFGLSDNLFSDEEDFIEKADNLVKVEENKDIVPIKNKIEKDAIQKHKEPAKRNLNEPKEKKTFEKSPKPKKSFEKSPKPTKSSHSSKIVDSSHKRENSYKKLSDYPDKGQQLLNKQIEEQKLKLKQFKKMENRNGVDLVTELRLNKQLKSKKTEFDTRSNKIASEEKKSINRCPESFKSVINEENKDKDLRSMLIEKARNKLAMLKLKKVQSKLQNQPHVHRENTRSRSPQKNSADRSRRFLMDKSPGRSYEDERLGPRSSEILNRYSEERRSRSKERLVRDGRPKKKKSNLVDPYLTRVISEEKPRSPEKKESSMERYHREESFRRNLNVNDLERRRADDAYINNVRERVIIEQSKKLALREEHGQFDIRTKSNSRDRDRDLHLRNGNSREKLIVEHNHRSSPIFDHHLHWQLAPIDHINQKPPSLDPFKPKSRDPRMKSSVVDRPGPKKSSFDQVPSRSSPVVSSRDPRIASNRPVEANIHPPAKTSKKESPIEVVKDSAPSSHNFTKFLEDSRKKLNSINSFLDSEVNSSILPSSIVEILRKASKAATPPLSSPKLPEDPIEIPRIVPKPTVIPEKLIVDDEPEVFVIKSDKQKAPKKKESVFLTTNILKPPGSQGLIKIIEVPPAMPGFKPFSFTPVPPPIMSANPPQRLQPKLPIIIPPIKRKDPDFGADLGIVRSIKFPKSIINKPRFSTYRTKPRHIDSKKGSTGIPISLQANFFRIIKQPDWSINQYSIEFEPPVTDIRVKKLLIKQHSPFLGGSLFDGTTIYLTKKLSLDNLCFPIKIIDSKEDFKITLKFEKEIDMLDSNSVNILNLILRRTLEGLKMQRIGKNLYDASAMTDLPSHKISIWPGFTSSIRQFEHEILINSDVTHQVMQAETVYERFIVAKREAKTFNYKDDFMKLVADTLVLTDYNNKSYRIVDIAFDANPETLFQTKNGMISFVNYYKNRYNIDIKDPKQPLLIANTLKILEDGQREKVSLIPELCRCTGLTEENKENLQMMQQLTDMSRLGPIDRINRLINFSIKINETQECLDVLEEWNLKLESQLVEVKGRMLPQETIKFGRNLEYLNSDQADWHSRMLNSEMFQQVPMTRWCVVYPAKFGHETEEFIKVLVQRSRALNYHISEPFFRKVMPNDQIDTYLTTLDDCISKNPELILLIVPNGSAERYAAIKTKCCIQRAIPTQVIQAKTLMPSTGGLTAIAHKIVIQMNCKLGGAPWMINLPLTGLMTIGVSINRDTKDKSKLYAALIASMDLKTSCKYFSCVFPHSNKEELSNEITNGVARAMKAWQFEHGNLPQRILFYRDSVSDAQLEYVHKFEVQMVLQKMKDIYSEAKVEVGPRMSYIVVNRKTQTRLFHNLGNPKPGALVDDVITKPERYDFFLVSNKPTRQGTVSPTSYNIIHDQCGLAPDRIQMLTYKMCHLYYNWSGTVRVPAVCQYAGKLSLLVAKYLHTTPSNLLEKQLYFL